MSYALQGRQYLEQVRSYALQVRQWENMVRNTIRLPQMVWMSLEGDIRTVQNILGSGSHYALNGGFSLGTLSSYTGYLGQVVNMPAKYEQWSRMANDNATSVLRGLGTQQDQMEGDQAVLREAQALVEGAEGQVQAIQGNALLTGYTAGEVQRLRQIELARAQMEVNRYAEENERRALNAAQWINFMGTEPPAMEGGQRW